MAAVELENPARHVVEKIAVVRDGDDGAFVLLEVLLEPLHGFGIEMVRRLVEQQDVRFLNHQPTQSHPPLLPARERIDFLIGGRTAKRIHRDLELILQLPSVGRFDLLLELRLLIEQLLHFVRRGLADLVADRFIFFEQRHQFFLAFFDDLFHGLVGIELRLLLEQTDAVAFGAGDLPGDNSDPRPR